MSSLQDKLYNYEETPPAQVWDKIAAALDESHIADQFPTTLYNAEVVPPERSWDKIAATLDPEAVPVVPMRGRSFTFWRYAAAAVFIGLVSLGVIKLIGTNKVSTAEQVAISPAENKKESDQTVRKDDSQTFPETQPGTSENANPDVASVSPARVNPIKRIRNNYSIRDNITATEPIYAYSELTPNIADRYIMLMTPEGGIIRMSKKLGNLVCCVSGQEQDENCKDQIKKWQEKIGFAPVATSPGNFMDILSLVSTLNDSEL